jgi:hypothetical protein
VLEYLFFGKLGFSRDTFCLKASLLFSLRAPVASPLLQRIISPSGQEAPCHLIPHPGIIAAYAYLLMLFVLIIAGNAHMLNLD